MGLEVELVRWRDDPEAEVSVDKALVGRVLGASVDHLEPHLTHSEEALGQPIDAGSFALGMLVAALILQHTDPVAAMRAMPDEFNATMGRARQRRERDIVPYQAGRLQRDFEDAVTGATWVAGEEVLWRPVMEGRVEVMLNRDPFLVRWVPEYMVAG